MNTHRRLSAPATILVTVTGCGGKSAPVELIAGRPGMTALSGTFANLKSAPRDVSAVTGLADLVIGNGRTRATITAAGLNSNAVYVAHVDADACSAANPGGDHFKFNPGAPDAPPNTIALPLQFEADHQGAKHGGVLADVTIDGNAGPARSMVIDLTRDAGASSDLPVPVKLACADLKPV